MFELKYHILNNMMIKRIMRFIITFIRFDFQCIKNKETILEILSVN